MDWTPVEAELPMIYNRAIPHSQSQQGQAYFGAPQTAAAALCTALEGMRLHHAGTYMYMVAIM